MTDSEKPSYRLLSGEDSHAFCLRVSAALEEGYILYGSPSAAFDPNEGKMMVAQAVIRPDVRSA